MCSSAEFMFVKLGFLLFFVFVRSTVKSVATCDNNSVNLLHDATVTICFVTGSVEHAQ